MKSKPVQRSLVVLQFATAAALVLTGREILSSPIALVIIAAGAALGIWAWLSVGLTRISVMPEIRSEATLVTHGPYRLLRHPMYTAVVLFCGGFVLASPAWWKLLVWLILIALVHAKSVIEEGFLRERFPEYETYAKRTGRFVPFL